MKNASICRILSALIAGFLSFASAASAANTLNYQGRVISGGTAFTGTGQFKFAFVSADGGTVYWKNDGTTDLTAPTTAVPLTVTKGIFSVLLGDASLSNMAAIPNNVFSNASMALRIWFNDGLKGFQQLSPDTKISPFSISSSTSQSQVNFDLSSQYFAAQLTPKFVHNYVTGPHYAYIDCATDVTLELYVDGVLYASGSWGSSQSAGRSTPHIRIVRETFPTLRCSVFLDQVTELASLYSSPLLGKMYKWRAYNTFGEIVSEEVRFQ